MSRLLLAAFVALAPFTGATRLAAADPPKVRLVVHVVFDQMRGDYVEKWRPLFGDGGFKRLQDQGAWFAKCYYPYATTSTGPGHSAMLSGATLDRTGIVNNEWYDRRAAEQVYCAGSDRYQLVPAPAAAKSAAGSDETARKPKAAGCPDRMLAETVADVLKRETGGKGKVFGLSLKDRSAILPTGKRPDGAYWFTDRFVTSTYYRDALPAWVAEFNASGAADRWFGRDWTRLRPDLDYAKSSGPDAVKGEANRNGQGISFPHPITGGKKAIGKEYYESLAESPFGNELLLEFAKACVVNEQLGQDDVPDLLVVSFSSNDLIGHAYGPDSQEVLDVTLRSDKTVADLLAFLDDKVGAGKYAVTLTADHGICPLPEVSAAKGRDARRVSSTALMTGAERHLREVYGKPVDAAGKPVTDEKAAGKAGLWLEAVPAPWVYLNDRQCKAKGVDRAAVAATLAAWMRKQPDVFRGFTAADITGPAKDDPVLEMVRRSYHPDRSGDVYVILKPYDLFGSPTATGTTHGTPHDYDRHVPLLAFGPGVPGGRRDEPATPQHAAAIAAHFLGVPPPKDAMYPLPGTLK